MRVYNVNKLNFFKNAPQFKKPEKVRISNVMKHVPSDINVFKPIDDGEDYIVERIGWNILERLNIKLEQVEGRKFSEASPIYYEIFKDYLKEVYETHKTKAIRIFYLISDKVQSLSNIHILYDEGKSI